MASPHVRVMGEAAVVSYVRLNQRLSGDGAPVTRAVEETRVWQKIKGQWRHVHFHRSKPYRLSSRAASMSGEQTHALPGCLLPRLRFVRCRPSARRRRSNRIPRFAPVMDDPKLPRVLLIGDSISIGYTVPTRKLLAGKANVHRIPENGGPTTNGAAKIKKWLGDGKWDVIHFNWGLHDLKLDTGKHQVPIDEYEKNLRDLVQTMKATGAKLIWASTTPVPEGKLSPKRSNDDVVAYNAVAKKIMEENGVAINDLYAFALPRLKEIQRPVNVHFSDAGLGRPRGGRGQGDRGDAALSKSRRAY